MGRSYGVLFLCSTFIRISPRTSARVHRAFLVRPLMQYHVHFHLHFLTLKQFNSVYFFMVPAGSIYFPVRSQQLFCGFAYIAQYTLLSLSGYSYIRPLFPIHSPRVFPSISPALTHISRALPSLQRVPIFASSCIHPWFTFPPCSLQFNSYSLGIPLCSARKEWHRTG